MTIISMMLEPVISLLFFLPSFRDPVSGYQRIKSQVICIPIIWDTPKRKERREKRKEGEVTPEWLCGPETAINYMYVHLFTN